MRIAFAILVGLHGLIHLLGPATAFGWAEVGQLRQPMPPLAGATWLAASVLLVVTAVLVAGGVRGWWVVALPGVLLSQWMIAQAWSDAKVGTVANLVILVPLAIAALDARPGSLRSRFVHDGRAALARPMRAGPLVTDADLGSLPPLMQTYLRRVGAVGRPRVRNFRVVFDAQMRSSATAPWMRTTAEQYEFFDPPARLFFMHASRSGVPFDVYHRYVGDSATFQVRVAGLIPVLDIQGAIITKSETVTLLNDIVILAPAAVLELPITWETTGERTVRAAFTHAGHTVSAAIQFDAAGDLVGFLSNDRYQSDAKGDRNLPWSTPVSEYREVGGIRIATQGATNWIEPGGEWTYGRFAIKEIAYNVER